MFRHLIKAVEFCPNPRSQSDEVILVEMVRSATGMVNVDIWAEAKFKLHTFTVQFDFHDDDARMYEIGFE